MIKVYRMNDKEVLEYVNGQIELNTEKSGEARNGQSERVTSTATETDVPQVQNRVIVVSADKNPKGDIF